MIKLVATDLDGTALRSWPHLPRVSDRLVAAVASVRAAGIPVVVVTGRSRRSAPDIARTIGADALICSNGALVWDLESDRVVRHRSFDAEVAHAIAARLRAVAPTAVFSWESLDSLGWEAGFHARWGGPRPNGHRIEGPVETHCRMPIVKLIASLHGDPVEQQRLFDELRPELPGLVGDEALFTTAGGAWIEIGAAGVTKALTLAEVATERGVTAADVIAFGDSFNDIAMLEWAGRGVAMANAEPEVLAIADEVTASNDDDGIALVLESLASA